MATKKRYHRKKSPCLLCGVETWDWDYVCDTCRVDVVNGRAVRVQVKSTVVNAYAIPTWVNFDKHENVHLDEMKQANFNDWMPFLVRVLGVPKLPGVQGRLMFSRFKSHLQDQVEGPSHGSVLITEDQAEAIGELFNLIGLYGLKQWQNGYRQGSFLLQQVADGSMRFDQIDKAMDKRY
jgi:hypothetical protein